MQALRSVHPGTGRDSEDLAEAEIRKQLTSILESKAFLSSRRCSSFLRYAVDRALAQDEEQLKEGAIARAVFGRTSVAEGVEDSVVRVCAREVRKRLDRYYQEHGKTDSIAVQLPVGTYVPRFLRIGGAVVETLPVIEGPLPEIRAPRFRQPLLAWTAALLLLSGTLLFGTFHFRGGRRFREFWAPVKDCAQPVLVCVGAHRVWGLSQRLASDFVRRNAAARGPFFEPPRPLPGSTISADDLFLFDNDHFTSGDMRSIFAITRMLDQAGKPMDLRLGTGISGEEIMKQPVILVGAFSNPWMIEWNRNLRYYFDFEVGKDHVSVAIKDRLDPQVEWSIPYLAREAMTVDYSIVSRSVDPVTGNALVAIGGLTHNGTQTAVEFVTDPDLLDAALAKAPEGWAKHNFEAVLETRVINRIPSRARVLKLVAW